MFHLYFGHKLRKISGNPELSSMVKWLMGTVRLFRLQHIQIKPSKPYIDDGFAELF